MSTWRARTSVDAPPEAVLAALTDPEALGRWSPVGFDVESLTSPRLRAGTRARVAGRLAGRRLAFDVAVARADPRRLILHAGGPVALDVDYAIATTADGSAVEAAITVRPNGGIATCGLARAVEALIAFGGLDAALARLRDESEAGRREPSARAPRELATAAQSSSVER